MRSKAPHRGLVDNPGAFAKRFVLDRLAGFEKDMEICLRPIPSKTRSGDTHAYFPALTACCGTLEYLAAMYCGRTKGLKEKDVYPWARDYMPQPDYDKYTIHVLWDAFRNTIAHRGIASGVCVDPMPGHGHRRRLTWKLYETGSNPSIQVVEENGILKSDPPWPCHYTHRVHIYLASLINDIRAGAVQFAWHLDENPELHENFYACMEKLYPK